MSIQTKQQIAQALHAFAQGSLKSNALALFKALGYESDKQLDLEPNTAAGLLEAFDLHDTLNAERAMVDRWQTVEFLFQLTKDEIGQNAQISLFTTDQVDNSIIESYLFLAIELQPDHYTRTDMAQITREVNKQFQMPVMILFKHDAALTFSIINRRLHKRDSSKDVLEKVTLIKDINAAQPHRAHVDILAELSIQHLYERFKFRNFVELHRAWQSVLDTSELNRTFYQEIARLFNELVGGDYQIGSKTVSDKGVLRLPGTTEDSLKKEFAVRLIGRLLFCWFLKKKTSPSGLPLIPEEILSRQAVNTHQGFDYYHAVLEPLFFEVLNKREPERLAQLRADIWQLIPFLNGGLFEPHQDDFYQLDRQQQLSLHLNTLTIPDSWFDKLFTVFEHYHFTIEENTPIEIEISIDPEMLGQIFENLLAEINPDTGETARKVTGSYYTPRAIVDYMVSESLKQYLLDHTPVAQEKLAKLLAYEATAPELTESEKDSTITALNNLKILDPSCGSGAFPMGILQKILLVLQRVDPDSQKWLRNLLNSIPDPAVRQVIRHKLRGEQALWDYTRKFGIIRNSIYGVDIQPIAAEISRLRCFLSLIVDEEIRDEADNRGVMPLPNLEFKFVCADTTTPLAVPKKNRNLQLFESTADIDELRRLLNEYFSSYGREKERIKQEFRAVQQKMLDQALNWQGQPSEHIELSTWNPFSHDPATWFDPEWMFGLTDGFDIVIGNPPYVRVQNLTAEMKKQHQQNYKSATSNYDLYVIFVERGLKLTNPTGQLAYILPHKFFNARYGVGLRGVIAEGQNLRQVVHFGGHQIFAGATNYTCLLFLHHQPQADFRFVQVDDLPAWYETYKGTEGVIPAKNVTVDEWNFVVGKERVVFERLQQLPTKLGDIANMFVGLQTSADTVFLFKEFHEKNGRFTQVYSKALKKNIDLEAELLKPVVRSGNIGRFWAVPTALVLFPYTFESGKAELIPSERMSKEYPYTWDYLLRNRQLLENREKGKFDGPGWFQLYPKNLDMWEQPKIMIPYMVTQLAAYYDEANNYFVNVTTGGFGITVDEAFGSSKYVVGLLNSTLLDWSLKNVSTNFHGGYFAANKQFLVQLPIRTIDFSVQEDALVHQQVENVVDYITFLKKQAFFESNNLGSARDKLMTTYFEQLIDGLVYELYFPDEMYSANKQFASLLAQEELPPLEQLPGEKVAALRAIFERLYHPEHPIRQNLFDLDTVPIIRIIEGKTK